MRIDDDIISKRYLFICTSPEDYPRCNRCRKCKSDSSPQVRYISNTVYVRCSSPCPTNHVEKSQAWIQCRRYLKEPIVRRFSVHCSTRKRKNSEAEHSGAGMCRYVFWFSRTAVGPGEHESRLEVESESRPSLSCCSYVIIASAERSGAARVFTSSSSTIWLLYPHQLSSCRYPCL